MLKRPIDDSELLEGSFKSEKRLCIARSRFQVGLPNGLCLSCLFCFRVKFVILTDLVVLNPLFNRLLTGNGLTRYGMTQNLIFLLLFYVGLTGRAIIFQANG